MGAAARVHLRLRRRFVEPGLPSEHWCAVPSLRKRPCRSIEQHVIPCARGFPRPEFDCPWRRFVPLLAGSNARRSVAAQVGLGADHVGYREVR